MIGKKSNTRVLMEVFQKRLRQYATLNETLWDAFSEVPSTLKFFSAEEDIIRSGDRASNLFVIAKGWAKRYRILEDGRKQIVNFMLPGDVFDLQALADLDADHSVSAITDVELLSFNSHAFLAVLRSSGDLASAFWWAAVQEESILREQIVRVGRRSARERIGHMLLELQRRLKAVDDSVASDFPLPLTRSHIADALGLTVVHVSRTISALKRAELIDESYGSIRITDRPRLIRLSQFDEDYLHNRRLDFLFEDGQTDANSARSS